MSSTTTQTTTSNSSHVQPRRRAAPSPSLSTAQPPSQPSCPPKDNRIRKGSTFQASKGPSSPQDPTLDIKNISIRSLTSPEALQDLCDESDQRVKDLLATFNRNLSGLGSALETDFDHQDKLPVPKSIVANVASKSTLMDDKQTPEVKTDSRQANHPQKLDLKYSVYTPQKAPWDLNDKNLDSESVGRALSDYATKVIKLHIIDPILKEEDLKDFHPLVKGLPHRIGIKQITCLRDLEKTLIFLAPVSTNLTSGEGVLAHCFLNAKTKARSPPRYLEFLEFSIQAIHTTVDHLNDIDQRRPTDRPYTNNYFVDLVEQVRAYARIMARSRAKKAKGQPLDDSDIQPSVPTVSYDSSGDPVLTLHTRGEKISLKGGISEDGKPAELVRERDGTVIAIDAGHLDDDEEMFDTDVMRSMARKRKCDIGKVEYHACRECGKVYTRPCDLTKHEKTHSRPWKCSHEDCKYYELGWPTEKERDRHVNDKHSSQPALYRCLFKPCTYTSKRESNCKQHMEKAHGWEYVRSKSRKGTKLVATVASPTTQNMPTPTSERLNTPMTGQSPGESSYASFSPAASLHSGFGSHASISSGHPSTAFSGSPASNPPAFDFNDYNKGYSYGDYLSPSVSAGRRPSVEEFTPPANMDGTSSYAPATNNTDMTMTTSFEDNFNFDGLPCDWNTMGEIFDQYNIPHQDQQQHDDQQVQQPTPASDFAFDFSMPAEPTQPEVSPGGRADGTLFGSSSQSQGGFQESQGFADFASSGVQSKHGQSDFPLFSDIPGSSADHAVWNTSTMFPDLHHTSMPATGSSNTHARQSSTAANMNSGMHMSTVGLDAGEFTNAAVDMDMSMSMFGEMSEDEMDRYLYGDGGSSSSGEL